MKPRNDNRNGKYIEDFVIQVPKKNNKVCGDYYFCDRSPESTIFILCDGLGSGVKANLSALMNASRLMELIRSGMHLYDVCKNVVNTMHKARTEDIPFAAFTIVKILIDGNYTVLSYEIPGPVIIEKGVVFAPVQRFLSMGHEVVGETTGRLKKGDCMVLVTDGVTQAGLGVGYTLGWGVDGFSSFLSEKLKAGISLELSVKDLVQETALLSNNAYMDDTTVAVLKCKDANILNILTGPPEYIYKDQEYVDEFMKSEGKKVVCGSTTSDIVSRILKRQIIKKNESISFSQPPQYSIEGIDLVSEGAITLNQVYNIFEENPDNFDEESVVTDLCRMIIKADIINFFVGNCINTNHKSIAFRQLGLIPRKSIVNLIIDKLKKMGKLVVINNW